MIGPSYQDFHSFLEQSPYAQIKSHKNKQQPETQQNKHEKPWDHDLGKYFEYFERKIKEKKNYFFPSELQTESIEGSPDLSPIKILDDGLAQQSSVLDQTIKLDRENSHVRSSSKFGFLSPHQDEATSKILDSAQIDKNVKRLLETMQEKIIKLEFENRKLKKENMDLTNQNKKYINQVGSFIHEQEKYAKVKFDSYIIFMGYRFEIH